MNGHDTIAAIATPPGVGGIGMIRLSGEGALSVFERCFRRASLGAVESHLMYYGHVIGMDGAVVDEAMGVFMKGPRSYTAEDVCEIHCHGGAVCVRLALRAALDAGARMAEPGEFTKRAFLNGRVDLSEAEAVMTMISASSEAGARSALLQMEGGVSKFVREVAGELTDMLAAIEAGNDFPDEIEEDVTRADVLRGIESVRAKLTAAADERAARIVRDGLSVVLVGAPNVGKSSLMNALLHSERAIVTEIPGTTRDVLTERMRLGGFSLEISDTAGQRETVDRVEQIGIERAQSAEKAADVVLVVIDASRALTDEDRALIGRMDGRSVLVVNKTDIAVDLDPLPGQSAVRVCAQTGEGITELIERIAAKIAASDVPDHQMTELRHIECAKAALISLGMAGDALKAGFPVDVATVDLMAALMKMTEITGESAPEGVIDRIFSQFCVGK